jgi:hypothetical protein
LLAGWAGFVCGGRGGKIRGHCAFSDASGWFRRTLPMAMITAIMFLLLFLLRSNHPRKADAHALSH